MSLPPLFRPLLLFILCLAPGISYLLAGGFRQNHLITLDSTALALGVSVIFLAVAIAVLLISSRNRTPVLAGKIDDTEREEAFRRIRESEAHLNALALEQRTILDATNIGICKVQERFIIWCNLAMATIFGYDQDEILNIPTRHFYLSDEDYRQFGAEAYPCILRGEIFQTERQMRRKDWTPVWVRVTGKYIDASKIPEGSVWTFEDISRRRENEIKLKNSETKFTTIFQTSPDVNAITEKANGRFVEVNGAFEKVLGFTREEAIGHTSVELGTWGGDESRQQMLEALGDKKHLVNFHTYFRRKSGEVFPVLLSLEAILIDGVECLIMSARDITEHNKVLEQLSIAKEAAEAANRAKSEFLSTMSHEIRTPMNAIIGMGQLLQYTELTGEQKEYLDAINASSKNLMALINDILDLSRIESGRIEFEQHEFSLRGSITDVINAQILLAQRKGLTIETDIAADAPDNLTGDQARFKRIILHFLGNAIKFTQTGGITISASMTEKNAHTGYFKIALTDTGIGISPDLVQKIFAPFSQADTSITRKYGGSGLGLNICARLAELMGGKIWVESAEGAGSTFYALLPFVVNAAYPGHPDLRPAGTLSAASPPALSAGDNEADLKGTDRIQESGAIDHEKLATLVLDIETLLRSNNMAVAVKVSELDSMFPASNELETLKYRVKQCDFTGALTALGIVCAQLGINRETGIHP